MFVLRIIYILGYHEFFKTIQITKPREIKVKISTSFEKERHAKPQDRRGDDVNKISAALNALLDQVTLISSSMENTNNRLSALESRRIQQTQMSNEQVKHEVDEQDHDDPAFGHRLYEMSSVDQLSVHVPPNQDLEIVSPAIMDTHDSHGCGHTTTKSLDPVPSKISTSVTTSIDENEHNWPEAKETEKSKFFNPTAETPSRDPSDTVVSKHFWTRISKVFIITSIFNILEETALTHMKVFTKPKLDKSLADQISPSYKKTAENRDKELSKVQRKVLNAAAP